MPEAITQKAMEHSIIRFAVFLVLIRNPQKSNPAA